MSRDSDTAGGLSDASRTELVSSDTVECNPVEKVDGG
jgi:hypothetical protein